MMVKSLACVSFSLDQFPKSKPWLRTSTPVTQVVLTGTKNFAYPVGLLVRFPLRFASLYNHTSELQQILYFRTFFCVL